MMHHDQHFTIVGFCDAAEKKRGQEDITFFAQEHRYSAAHIPPQDELRRYAERLGYFQSRKRGFVLGKCEPVYHVHGAGLDYLRCPDCYAPSQAEGAMA